jgi:Actin maturation protease-like, C-terminal domain
VPTVTTDEIEELVANPKRFSIEDIKVLRYENDGLPDNTQVGPTCGIYALQAAIQIRGELVAPRRRALPEDVRDSVDRKDIIRPLAKDLGLTKIGEIGGAFDLVSLAAGLGHNVEIKNFQSKDELWTLVKSSIDAGHSIVLPYACADDDGTPAWAARFDSFAHWCLLFGYVEYAIGPVTPRPRRNEIQRPALDDTTINLRRVFMTTYGKYQEASPYRLFKANQRIQDWPRQTWIKLAYWFKNPQTDEWSFDRFEWVSEAKAVKTVTDMVDFVLREYKGWGFALGGGREEIHAKSLDKLIDQPNATKVNPTQVAIQNLIVRRQVLQEARYSQTMCGQCVVV